MTGGNRGRLYLIATPIGNWEDITVRALRVLAEVSVVAAEDTRYARRLFGEHGIRTPLVSCHAYNEERRIGMILERLEAGEDVGLVTDAGTPGVSDPGAALVAAAAEAEFEVIALPGPSSVIAAVSLSGLKGQGFRFAGFLPRTGSKRRKRIESFRDDDGLLVLYESPRRVAALVDDLLEVLGDRPAVLCRELTKVHEEVLRSSLSGLVERFRSEVKGEVVLVVGPSPRGGGCDTPRTEGDEAALRAAADSLVAEGIRTKDASQRLARVCGLSRNEAYRLVLEAVGRAGADEPAESSRPEGER